VTRRVHRGTSPPCPDARGRITTALSIFNRHKRVHRGEPCLLVRNRVTAVRSLDRRNGLVGIGKHVLRPSAMVGWSQIHLQAPTTSLRSSRSPRWRSARQQSQPGLPTPDVALSASGRRAAVSGCRRGPIGREEGIVGGLIRKTTDGRNSAFSGHSISQKLGDLAAKVRVCARAPRHGPLVGPACFARGSSRAGRLGCWAASLAPTFSFSKGFAQISF
jgi:hypothetical protein